LESGKKREYHAKNKIYWDPIYVHGPFDKFVDSDTSSWYEVQICHCKVCLVLGRYTKFHYVPIISLLFTPID
jgi:hypothetical protein